MATGFKINGTDFDDLFMPTRSGYSSVTFTGLSPTCTYMARVSGSNPNAAGYWTYNGVAYDAQPKNVEPVPPSGAKRVGGMIFYINSSSTNSYTFYDGYGNVISAPSVGSSYGNYYYIKSGSGPDKYYVRYPALYQSKGWCRSSYFGATGYNIGEGRSNTEKVIKNASYLHASDIFYIANNLNKSSAEGCNDWYVPDYYELYEFYKSGIESSWFSKSIWTSTESDEDNAYYWYGRSFSTYDKIGALNGVFIRSF